MNVTAALCWYDESVADLERCVRGMANVADRVVAFDGGYARYPNAQPTSPPEQAEAIQRTAEACGMEAVVYVPDRLWRGQVEKRDALTKAAAAGADWVVIVDADHVIRADRDAVRAELEATTADVLMVRFRTPADPTRPLSETVATNWHLQQTWVDYWQPVILRVLPSLRVERFHWWYRAEKTGWPVWMWGGNGGPTLRAESLRAPYEVEHLCLHRDERHIRENRAFCNDRVKVVALTGQEDDVPGLPDPVFDYETVPY